MDIEEALELHRLGLMTQEQLRTAVSFDMFQTGKCYRCGIPANGPLGSRTVACDVHWTRYPSSWQVESTDES